MITVEKHDEDSIKITNTVVSEQFKTRKQLRQEKQRLRDQLQEVNDQLALIPE